MIIWEIVTDSTVLGFGVSSTQVCACVFVCYGSSRWCVSPWASIFPSTGGSFEKPLTFKCLLQQMGKDPTISYSIQTWAYMDKHCPLLFKQCLLLFTNQNVFKANFSAYSAYTFKRKGSIRCFINRTF